MSNKLGTPLAILSIVSLLGSCGNNSDVTPDGDLFVDTSSFTVTQPANPAVGVFCSGIVNGVGTTTDDAIIKITTIDDTGNPAGKLDVELSAAFAENTSSGGANTAIFIVDKGVDVLVSAATDPAPFTAVTDENGELFIKLRLDTTFGEFCFYSGELKIASGVHTKQVEFAVKPGT